MFRWFAQTPAYQADIRAVKAIEPSAWDLPTWLRSTGWTLPTPGRRPAECRRPTDPRAKYNTPKHELGRRA